MLCHNERSTVEDELQKPLCGCQIVDDQNFTIEFLMLEATRNLFDLRDREIKCDPEVLDTRGCG